MTAQYKPRLYRILKDKRGQFIIQHRGFLGLWFTETYTRYYFDGGFTYKHRFDGEESAVAEAHAIAEEHKANWEKRQEAKQVARESRSYKKDLGRLP